MPQSRTTSQSTSLDDLFLNPEQRNIEPRRGQIGETRMRVKAGGIDEAKRQIHFVCSTDEVDRYNESVAKVAWEKAIDPFMDNPVFPAGHVYIGLSGEPTIIGHWVKLWLTKDGLEGIAEFDDSDPLAIRYWNLYRKGHMKAVSVGFIAIAWEMRDFDIDGRSQKLRVFTEVELIEISAVAIGANRSALVRAASANNSGATGPDNELLKRLQSLIERLEKSVHGKQDSPISHGQDDDAADATGYLAHFMDDEGDIITDGEMASHADGRPGNEEAATKELNNELRRVLAIGA